MKLLKIFWYSLIVIFFLAGLLTGRREFFLLFIIAGFVPLYSMALNLWTVFSFTYVQKVEKNSCIKGGETSLQVMIHNEKPFPFALIRLAVAPVVRSQKAKISFSLPPGSHITFTVPLPCPYRGVFGVGMTDLELNDCFGLVRTRFDMQRLPYYRLTPLKIYPRLSELPVLHARQSDNKNFGNINQRYAEQGESYAGLRKYRPGDPLKRVHRAVSARRRELYVRTYDTPFETSILIVIDTDVGCESEEDGLYLADLACECAAAIAHYSLRAGHRVVFSSTGAADAAQKYESMREFPRLYDRLAVLSFDGQGDLTNITRKAAVSDMQAVYVISARRDGGLLGALEQLGTGNVKLILLTRKKSHALSDAVSDKSADRPMVLPGVGTVQIAVGDDVVAVLCEEAGLI